MMNCQKDQKPGLSLTSKYVRNYTMEHIDPEVRRAIIRLDDALCTYERATGRESIIIIREQGGFVHRAACGKPDIPSDIGDDQLLAPFQL